MSPTLLEEIPPPRLTPVGGCAERRCNDGGPGPGAGPTPCCAGRGATIFAVIVLGLVVSLLATASQAFGHSGVSFLWSGTYNATKDIYPTGHLHRRAR